MYVLSLFFNIFYIYNQKRRNFCKMQTFSPALFSMWVDLVIRLNPSQFETPKKIEPREARI